MKQLRITLTALFICMMGFGSSMAYASPTQTITNSVADQVLVSTSSGSITLISNSEEPVLFQIFSITGQVIKSTTVTQGSVSIDLPRGYYIVKCEHWSKTVIVK